MQSQIFIDNQTGMVVNNLITLNPPRVNKVYYPNPTIFWKRNGNVIIYVSTDKESLCQKLKIG